MNDKTIVCDIAVIGAGSGGLSVAAGAAQMGADVVLIESGKMGGDCLNYGCIPSKSLLASAKTYWQAKHSEKLGVSGQKTELNFDAVMKHLHDVIEAIAPHDSVERFEGLGVKVIKAAAKFVDRRTIQAGDHTINAKRFVIATGSYPFVPSIKGMDTVSYLTNENIFDLTVLPEKLIVIGGGPIGCELAQAFAMLGSKVTILEAFKMLPKDEADCVEVIKSTFENMNIGMHEGIAIENIEKNNDLIQVNYEANGSKQHVQGTHLLVATGRRPQLKELALDKAAVVHTDKGVQVDQRLRTSNKKIYAIGDVIGGYQFTHVANYHAGIVIKNILFRLPAKVDSSAIPWVTYTHPELAHVGLLSEEAKSRRLNVKATEWLYAESDRAQAENKTQGKIKILTDKKARILGATIVGEHADDLLMPWIMAVREKKTLRTFTDLIVPYPTLSEINKLIAGEFYKPVIFSNKVKTLVKWLLKLG